METSIRMFATATSRFVLVTLTLLLTAFFFAGVAQATVNLRVESRPISGPIEAYVTVTDGSGAPVGGLTAANFTITVDGQAVTLQPSSLSLPPSENPSKNVSVVFVMDYSPSTGGVPRADMESSVVTFLNSMFPGDYAAIVKFNDTNPAKASVVRPFTMIDWAAGSAALTSSATSPYSGSFSNVYDAISVALDHFASPPTGVVLPDGPKAVIVISDGLDNRSVSTLGSTIDKASSLGIPLFTVAVATPGTTGSNVMESLAARSGGSYISAPTNGEVTNAYATISSRLDNSYLISFPSSIGDCDQHTLQVAVTGQTSPASVPFTRCDALRVPDVRGKTQAEATTAITAASLAVGTISQESSSTVIAGRVIRQDPAAGGASVTAGTVVRLVLSTGPAPGTVPNVVGLTQEAASSAITTAGLVVGATITQQPSNTVPAGTVISQNPVAGTSVAAGSAVTLVVSTGPAQGTVPNVVGVTQAAATTALTGAGLVTGAITQQSSATVPSGRVISQNPVAGTSLQVGSAVSLVISTGPALGTVPNVVGLSQAAATTAITTAGLVLGTVTQQASTSVPAGNVISQNPASGGTVAAGSAVNLVVSTGPAPAPPSGGGGGGGSMGLGGLALLGLAAAFANRRRKRA